jgi:mannitol-specific phosphotransferase system IIBC component
MGTAGGTLLVILLNISREELLKTIVLAAIGAAVSFFISMILRLVVRKIKYFRKIR